MYLGMRGAVVLSWQVAPVLSLVCFLLMSVVHWGLGDTEEDLVSPSMLALEVGNAVPLPSLPAILSPAIARTVSAHTSRIPLPID